MKKFLMTLPLVLMVIAFTAQEDMSIIWEQKMDHKIVYKGTGLEGSVSYCASEKEITVFNNKDASTAWTTKFKDLAPKLSKVDEIIPFWESRVLFLFDRKMGKDQVACVDLDKGTLLWNTDKFQNLSEDNIVYIPEMEAFALSLKEAMVMIKAKTGEELWQTTKFKGVVGQYIYNRDDMSAVMVNFVPGGLAALFTGFKNQIMRINLTNGNILWEATYIGRAERKVISREFVYDLDTEGGKVFLRLNGMQVYDYNTGAQLWSAAFDYTPDGIVGSPANAKKFGVYGAVADPVVSGNHVYVLDMSNRRSQYIKKYDLNTGKLIWTSPEIKEARAIPNMYVVGDKVVLQVGGNVEAQAYIYRRTTDADGSVSIYEEWKIWHPNVKPFNVQCFNTSDGSQVWESERFKKGITNMMTDGTDIFVCSGKALYCLNTATGADKYEVPLSDDGIGLATQILDYNGMIVVVGEKGVSTHGYKDGKLINSAKYKSSDLEDVYGNVLIMKTASADIAAYDLNTCKYKEFKAKTGATTTLMEEGKLVYVYENKVVTKLSTK
jgi:outer membrane protein assembly factor BamB